MENETKDLRAEFQVYTVNEIAGLFKKHPRTIKRWIQRGDLNAKRIGLTYYIRRVDIEKLLAGD